MSNVGETHFDKLARRYASLSFVKVDVAGESVEFWSVNATGKWHVDFDTGARHARCLIEFMARETAPYFLEGVVGAMNLVPSAARTGIEAGFIFQIAQRLIRDS